MPWQVQTKMSTSSSPKKAKIVFVDAGAFGHLLGVQLSLQGHDVSFVKSFRKCDGPQDLIVVGLKMRQIATILEDLPSVLGPKSLIITTQNDIPWWFCQQYNGPIQFRKRTVDNVGPGGLYKSDIDTTPILATVVYPSATKAEPDVIQHVEGERFPTGKPDGSNSERAQWVSSLLIDAGFEGPMLDEVRGELWVKL